LVIFRGNLTASRCCPSERHPKEGIPSSVAPEIQYRSTTAASVTFTSLTHGGYLYLLGGQGAADLNVNGPYTLGPVIEAIALSGFGASFDANVPGKVSSFGKFDLSLNNSDGFHDSATSLGFTLNDTGAPWSSAAGVLTPDDAGFLARLMRSLAPGRVAAETAGRLCQDLRRMVMHRLTKSGSPRSSRFSARYWSVSGWSVDATRVIVLRCVRLKIPLELGLCSPRPSLSNLEWG
jgi:hypothetical protein